MADAPTVLPNRARALQGDDQTLRAFACRFVEAHNAVRVQRVDHDGCLSGGYAGMPDQPTLGERDQIEAVDEELIRKPPLSRRTFPTVDSRRTTCRALPRSDRTVQEPLTGGRITARVSEASGERREVAPNGTEQAAAAGP
jgi:hypothetical protein